MNTHSNVPEEDLDLSFDLNLEDITKAVEAAVEKPKEEAVDTSNNFLDVVQDAVKAEVTNDKKEEVPTQEGTTYDENAFSAALELLAENNLLTLPEELGEVTEEKWNEIIQDNKMRQRQALFDEVKSNAGDPRIAELVDFAYNGGSWYGVEEMQQAIQAEINLDELDTGSEEDQRYLIESYLSEGLNPDNPIHALRLKNVPNEVNSYFERLESEELAKEAKQFYMNQFESHKQALYAEQEANRQKELNAQREAKQAEEMWINTFKDTLSNRTWSETKKNDVISQFDIVTLEDGRETELWRYKFESIWQDPQAAQVFLDFLSDYDHNNMQFNRNGVPSSKQATKLVTGILNSKSQNKPKGQYTSSRKVATNSRPIIDPRQF